MESSSGRRPERRAGARATIVIALLLTAAAIHIAQPILVPIALAVLLAFVVGPVVGLIERRVGRLIAVAVVVIGLWSVLGAVTWGVTRQIASFARELPQQYRAQLRQRVAELRRATRDPVQPGLTAALFLGRHVPELQYITVLIGDQPVLSPPLRLYQRLLAGDQEEAADLIEGHLATGSPHGVYDDWLLPALSAAKVDRLEGALSEADERVVLRATSRIVGELEGADAGHHAPTGVSVLAFPVHDTFDELALRVLKQVLAPVGAVEIASSELLSAEAVALAAERGAPIVVVGSLPPGGYAQLRYLCKRLRRDLPLVKIAAGPFAEKGTIESHRDALMAAGADAVVSSLVEARDRLVPWIQFAQNAPARPEPGAEPRVA